MRTDYEAFFYFQNLMLLGQAMGLGGWIHGAVFTPYIWQREPAKDWHGLGFRMEQPEDPVAVGACAGLAAQPRRHRRRSSRASPRRT